MKTFMLMTVMCLCVTCFAQTSSWKEFDNFHAAVSKVLHPVMLGKIQPVKDSSSVLLAKAKAWQSSTIPKNVDAAVFKTHIAELVTQCSELDEAVKLNQADAVLIKKANTIHETFHALLNACNLKD